MEIIKEGLSYKELEQKRKAVKRFKCDYCGCVFDAEKDEYECKQYNHTELGYCCQCPHCDSIAREDKNQVTQPNDEKDIWYQAVLAAFNVLNKDDKVAKELRGINENT